MQKPENVATRVDHHTVLRSQWLDRLKDLSIEERLKGRMECQLLAIGQRNGNGDKISVDLLRTSAKKIVAESVKEKSNTLLLRDRSRSLTGKPSHKFSVDKVCLGIKMDLKLRHTIEVIGHK